MFIEWVKKHRFRILAVAVLLFLGVLDHLFKLKLFSLAMLVVGGLNFIFAVLRYKNTRSKEEVKNMAMWAAMLAWFTFAFIDSFGPDA
ncbi:MAG: hypothetical protein LBO70_00220 [Clostridiales Family XIII bacterium]|jgi:Flp pilus assembly protein TadB|nr:hypothetical protein [Clostridiales Family XIII bacterium]